MYKGWTMIWYVYRMNVEMIFWLCFKNYPNPLITTIPQFILPISSLTLLIKMAFLVVLESVQVEEGLAARWAHHPHPQVHFAYLCINRRMGGWWALLAALNLALVYLFDAPSWMQRVAYGWGWPPLKLEEQLERQPSSPGLQAQKHQVLWTPEEADGRWWQKGCDRLSYEEVGLEIWRNVTLFPQKPIETLCLWTCHHHFHLLKAISL